MYFRELVNSDSDEEKVLLKPMPQNKTNTLDCQSGSSSRNQVTNALKTKEQPGAYETYIDLIDTASPPEDENSAPVTSLWEAATEPVSLLEQDCHM